ncbi:MAG TPA: ABC transporter ATP-binding protein, partial [Nitrosomonas sp.]|nr:ABC transporter ATP-binding protein [Nitrosomonas sp.]
MEIPIILKDQRRRLFIRLVINGLIQAGLTISTAWIVKEIFDRFLLTQHLMLNFDVIGFGIALIIIAACIGWLRMVERLDAEQIGQNYIAETRILLYDYFCTLAPRSIQKRSRGTVLLRFVSDMTALKRWISLGLSRLTVAGVSTLTALFILAIINWQLTLAVTLSLVTGGYIAYTLGSRLRIAARETRRRLSYLAANLSDKVANIAVVQLFDQVGRERERIIRQNKQLHDSMIERARVAGQIHGITEFSAAVTSAIALFTGIIAVASGEATVGSVVAAITVVGILMPPLRELGRVQEYWHGACVSREKLKTFLETPSFVTEISNAPALNITSGRLEFDSVTVSGGI